MFSRTNKGPKRLDSKARNNLTCIKKSTFKRQTPQEASGNANELVFRNSEINSKESKSFI